MARDGKKTSGVVIDKNRCKGCLLCLDACSRSCLVVDSHLNKRGVFPVTFKKGAVCTGCGMCVLMCPDCALRIVHDPTHGEKGGRLSPGRQ